MNHKNINILGTLKYRRFYTSLSIVVFGFAMIAVAGASVRAAKTSTLSSPTVTEIDATGLNAVVNVVLDSAAPVGGTTVIFDLIDGTATNPEDYIDPLNDRIIIPQGSTAGSYSIPIIGDLTYELPETFKINATADIAKDSEFNSSAAYWTPFPTKTFEIMPELIYGGQNGANNVLEVDSLSQGYQDLEITPGVEYEVSYLSTRRTVTQGPALPVSSNMTISVVDPDNAAIVIATQTKNYANLVWDLSRETFLFTSPNLSTVRLQFTTDNTVTLGVILDKLSILPAAPDASATITINDNDTLRIEFDKASDTSSNETGTPVQAGFAKLLISAGTLATAETVEVDIIASTATFNTDYTSTDPIVVIIPAGTYDGTAATAVPVPAITINQDTNIEGDELVNFEIKASSLPASIVIGDVNGNPTVQSTYSYTITDDDTIDVEFSSATYASTDESTNINLVLEVTGGVSIASKTIEITVTGGTATSGTDFTFTSPFVVSIPADDYTTTKTINVLLVLIDDPLIEGNETVTLSLGNSEAGVTAGTLSATTATITDDDMTIEFDKSADSSTNETGTPIQAGFVKLLINGTLTTAKTIEIDITASTATFNTDYTSTDPIVVTIPAGTYDGTAGTAVAVPAITINQDTLVEGNELVNFEIKASSLPASIAIGDVNGDSTTQSTYSYTITDDDSVAVEFSSAVYASTDEASSVTLTLEVTGGILNASKNVDIIVTGGTATGLGIDYTFASPNIISIPAGDYTATQTIDVTIALVDDTLIEGNETIDLQITNPATGMTVGAVASTVVTIADDDITVEFDKASDTSTAETGMPIPSGFVKLLISGTIGSAKTINVDIVASTATFNTDYTSTDPIVVTIPAGSYDGTAATAVAVPAITIVQDARVEGLETINFEIQASSLDAGTQRGDANGDSTNQQTYAYNITDDDTLSVEFAANAFLSANEVSGIPVTLDLTGAEILTSKTVEVNVTGGIAIPGTDYNFGPTATIVIPAGDYSNGGTYTFEIQVIDDMLVEVNEGILLSLSNPGPDVSLGIRQATTAYITDDDVVTINIDPGSASGGESTSNSMPQLLITGLVNATTTVTVSDLRTGTAVDGLDYSYPGSLVVTIPAGLYDGTSATAITVPELTVIDDDLIENDETIIIGISNATGDAVLGVVTEHVYTIVNDDELFWEILVASDGAEPGVYAQFTVMVGGGKTLALGRPVSVGINYGAGSATHNVDYSDGIYRATLNDGEQSMTFSVPVIDDRILEDDESITVVLGSNDYGVISIPQATALIIDEETPETADSDGDGQSDAHEFTALNNGDGNGDGIQDSLQSFVTSRTNPISGVPITMVLGNGISDVCRTITGFSAMTEYEAKGTDKLYNYPNGLYDYVLECIPACSTEITYYMDKHYNTTDWKWRKYHKASGGYVNMDADFSSAVVGGRRVTTVSYSIRDGGRFDEDGIVNGQIVDPSGPAVPLRLAKAGVAAWTLPALGILLASASVTVVTSRGRINKKDESVL